MPRSTSRVVTTFTCSVCRTGYTKRTDAARCKKRPVEGPTFKAGDVVRAKERRTCSHGKDYVCQGEVTRVSGPLCPDEEYERKWLGGVEGPDRLAMHVRQYTVRYSCPHCGEERRAKYYGPELVTSSAVAC
jgi:hypothetical protein